MTTKFLGKRKDGALRVVTDMLVEDDLTRRSTLPLRLDIRNHSPSGFECGYGGSGPAQLALAICANHLSRHDLRAQSAAVTLGIELKPVSSLADRVALLVYQDYKHDVVASLPRESDWTIDDEAVGVEIDRIVSEQSKSPFQETRSRLYGDVK